MNRTYVAICRYPGKKQFMLGTFVGPAQAKEHELRPLAAELWSELSPHPCPEITQIIPGMLVFQPEA